MSDTTSGEKPRIGIVGAGVAGAGAAYALRDVNAEVVLLDKARGVGGRTATRRRDGRRYDHGANYVKADDEGRTVDLLRSLGEDGLVPVEGPVWTFDDEGTVAPGRESDATAWTWEAGITQLAKRLIGATDASVRKGTRVERVRERDGEWRLTDAEGGEHGPFDAVLLTPPAPQTADLLRATDSRSLAESGRRALTTAVADVPFRTIRTLVLHYPHAVEAPFYGLVHDGDDHPVSWLSREECKPGHVPDGESLLIVQMSPAWSTAHYDDPLEAAAATAAEHAAALLDDDRLLEPDWVDDQGWRYALPDAGIADGTARSAEESGLFLAGDWVAGEARVHAALWNGVAAGERIAGRFDA